MTTEEFKAWCESRRDLIKEYSAWAKAVNKTAKEMKNELKSEIKKTWQRVWDEATGNYRGEWSPDPAIRAIQHRVYNETHTEELAAWRAFKKENKV